MSLEEIAQGKIKYDYAQALGPSSEPPIGQSAIAAARCSGHNGAMARVLLGVTGGIAAYKACELYACSCRRATTWCRSSRPAPSGSFAPRRSCARAARARGRSLSAPRARRPARRRAAHREHAREARARAGRRRADRGGARARGPVLVAPAMNTRMWAHPATRANVETLRARGVELVGPDEGELAEGEVGARADGRARGDRARGRGAARRRRHARREARARDRRRDARAGRRGAVRRQPLVGPDGRRASRRRLDGAGQR